jgi:hypothetical protein
MSYKCMDAFVKDLECSPWLQNPRELKLNADRLSEDYD